MPPLTYDQSPGTSIQYDNDLSGVESHNNDGDGLIHPEENDKRWSLGFSEARKRGIVRKMPLMNGWSVGADRSGVDTSTHLGIGFLVAKACDDRALVFELCERASASEGAAREAAKALKVEFKCVVLEFIE